MNFYFLMAVVLMTICATAVLLRPALGRVRAKDTASSIPFLVTALLVPVIAVGLYAYLGSPQAANADTAQTAALAEMARIPADRTRQKQIASVSSMVDGLAKRLEQEPDDAGSWLLLAKSYKHLNERENAGTAYEKAVALGKSDPDMAAWLTEDIAALSEFTGIRGRVRLPESGDSQLDGSETVFIIAKATSGSPMPLAVQRTSVSSLPYEFQLTDEDSMIAGSELSTNDQVIISTKISSTGDAFDTVKKYETTSGPVSTSAGEYLDIVVGELQ